MAIYPFVKARWFRPAVDRKVNYIVIHDMESPEQSNTAEAVANMFATTNDKKSCHYCVDNDSIVQCVLASDVAYHAPPNEHSIGIEHAGYARQTKEQWLDDYGQQMLDRSAKLAAELCIRYGIPPKRLSPQQLRDGYKGIAGHVDVTRAWGLTNHTDPGDNFPWDFYLQKVAMYVAQPTTLDQAAKVMATGTPVAIRSTSTGNGYVIVASDGGVFTYGDAQFHGSTGGTQLNAPIVDIAMRPQDDGYWLIGADYGVFAFGNAHYMGHP